LKTIASAVLFDRQPFDRIVRWRTVAKVLSMGLVVRRCFMAYVEQVLVPTLTKGDIVFMDNLRTYKIDGVRQVIAAQARV
jgi:hypothetical protein